MARHPLKKKNIVAPDHKYNSVKVEKFVNYIMEDGKKETARTILYRAFDEIVKQTKVENPLEVFDKALKNVGPLTEVRSRRIGGANYTVPRDVRTERRLTLAMRWLLQAAKAKKGRAMHLKLAEELILASNNEGDAVTKRINTHKMAEANKAFAHFAW